MQQALTALKEHKTVTWLLDSGLDDIAVCRTIWEQQEHVVWRLSHIDRKVAFQDRQRYWHEGDIAKARANQHPLARVETSLEARRGKQMRMRASLRCMESVSSLPAATLYSFLDVYRAGAQETPFCHSYHMKQA